MLYSNYPKFIHNLWSLYEDKSEIYYLRISNGTYEIEKNDAEVFLKFRSFCTGNNSRTEISKMSNVSLEKINLILNSLEDIEMFRKDEFNLNKLDDESIYEKFVVATEMWSEQLQDASLFDEIIRGKHTLNTLKGFLLETYHYVKLFPETLLNTVEKCHSKKIKNELIEYYNQEKGHESFILETLLNFGFKEQEVVKSIPLVSTQNIINLMEDLFIKYPITVFLLSRIIEADEFSEENAEFVRSKIKEHFNLDRNSLDKLMLHAKVDFDLGHSNLIYKNKSLITLEDKNDAHFILNRIHDIKHAFDLQKIEIIEYYNHTGNYIPRQKVDFFGV